MSEDFAAKLHSLVSLEVSKGTIHDKEKMAGIVENLASSLGFTVALAAGGDPNGISHLLEGMTSYIYEVAAERAPLAKMIASARVMNDE